MSHTICSVKYGNHSYANWYHGYSYPTEKCIHCGHTQPMKEDNMRYTFDQYRYIVVSKDHEACDQKNHGAWEGKESAKHKADELASRYPKRQFAVAEVYYTPEPKETIKDLEGKTYTVDRLPCEQVRITAPCGQSQSFSKEELRRLIDGTD